MGAVPTVCVFRPLQGTDLEDHEPPRADELRPVFAHLYEACQRQHLPIGLAPNVHVSLVLLPEECRTLAPRRARYWLAEQQRRIAARLFRWQFERRLQRFRVADA